MCGRKSGLTNGTVCEVARGKNKNLQIAAQSDGQSCANDLTQPCTVILDYLAMCSVTRDGTGQSRVAREPRTEASLSLNGSCKIASIKTHE